MRAKLLLVAALALVPLRAGCQAYAFTTRSTVEALNDTIYWAHTSPMGKVDTLVYQIRKDSSVRIIRPGPQREVPEAMAKHLRFLYNEARESDALMERLRNVPKR